MKNETTMMTLARRSAGALRVAALATGVALSAVAAQAEKVLTVGNPFPPISLDPALSGNGRAGTWLLPAYEPLVRTKADGSFAPALAESWKVADDSMSVTFKLRADAKFADGTPVTADAVKKSVEYFMSKKGPFSANLKTMTSIDAVSPTEVKVSLSAPNPNIVTLFDASWPSGDIISPKGLEKPEALLTGTYGAGPYVLDMSQSVSGKSYTYVPNANYYDKSLVSWDKIVISVFEDQNAGIQAMKAGQLNILISDPLTGNANAGSLGDKIRLETAPIQWAGIIPLDRDGSINKPLGDLRVRQAMNYGIDRKLVASALFGKLGEGTDQIQVGGYMGFDPANEAKYPYDLAKAKKLLADAGYPNGFTTKMGYVANTLNTMMFQAYADQLSNIGITATPVPFQGFGPMIQAFAAKSIDTLVFNTNSGVPNIAKFQMLDVNGSLNPYHSTDEELTKLVEEASELPIDKAEAAWKKVYARVVDIAWAVPVAAVDVTYFVTNNVETPHIGQSVIMDFAWVKPAK